MKQLTIYQIDAFATSVFTGNPAAVCPLDEWLSDQQMQAIAQENNLSETAFIVPEEKYYRIRWFTPNTEVDLCGHATLASAFVLFNYCDYEGSTIAFQSNSGALRVTKKENHALEMDFPALPYQKIQPQATLLDAMSIQPTEVYQSTFDLICVFENESDIRMIELDLSAMSQLPHRGVIVTAPSSTADVYSRCFYPACNVPEDAATGSAHCVIAPFWCERMNKTQIHAVQGLHRQGTINCEFKDNRVLMTGACHLYMQGTLFIPDELKRL